MLFMSIWWQEIPSRLNYHVIECAMKGFCEWFRDTPIVVWPNICSRLPTISKWTSSIADVLAGIYVVSLAGICVVFICDLALTCKKRQELKLENVLIKVSYQLIHRRNVHGRKVHRRIGVAEMSHSGQSGQNKILENLGKIPENPGKNGAQSCLISKNGVQPLEKNTWRPFFGGHTNKRSLWSLWDKVCRQKSHKNFSGKFGEIRAKILRTPKNLPASSCSIVIKCFAVRSMNVFMVIC